MHLVQTHARSSKSIIENLSLGLGKKGSKPNENHVPKNRVRVKMALVLNRDELLHRCMPFFMTIAYRIWAWQGVNYLRHRSYITRTVWLRYFHVVTCVEAPWLSSGRVRVGSADNALFNPRTTLVRSSYRPICDSCPQSSQRVRGQDSRRKDANCWSQVHT